MTQACTPESVEHAPNDLRLWSSCAEQGQFSRYNEQTAGYTVKEQCCDCGLTLSVADWEVFIKTSISTMERHQRPIERAPRTLFGGVRREI